MSEQSKSKDDKFAVQIYYSWPVCSGIEGTRTSTFAPFGTTADAQEWAKKTSDAALRTRAVMHAPFRVVPMSQLHPSTIYADVAPPGITGGIIGMLAWHAAEESRLRLRSSFALF